jgi:hypothetical protein
MNNHKKHANIRKKKGFTEHTEIGFEALVGLFEQTQTTIQKQATRSLDIALVVRNWLFGWYIVEFENGGVERAELYGKELIKRLSHKLTETLGKGFSKRSLEQYRKFYITYLEIAQALPAQSSIQEKVQQASSVKFLAYLYSPDSLSALTEKLTARFILGWTHYATLLTIENPDERRFYEIEAAENAWGYRELERQIKSALYERLALSRDKEEVKRLTGEGQIIERPTDVIKNPYILEFTAKARKAQSFRFGI